MSANTQFSPDSWDRGRPQSVSSAFEDLVLDVTRQLSSEMGYSLPSVSDGPHEWFHSTEAQQLKEEIAGVGRKLWEREYVDGAGGNISVRLGPDYVLCTPTMLSKGDLTPDDICMTDLDGNLLSGHRSRTSELLLHLAIYKATPRASAVVHCHPPYATAWSLTASGPPTGYLVEQEIFVGRVPLARYETPGTAEFASTVLPFVDDCNSVLLSNHGIVCWAETATRAEWMVEIVETYCHTLLIASQLGAPISRISPEKMMDIEVMRRRLAASPRVPGVGTCRPPAGSASAAESLRRADLESIVRKALSSFADRINWDGAKACETANAAKR
jgi:L-fuculose-phosphate aldolase